jgi:hypothetical protein
MTLDEIEQTLPWGLHDALLLRLSVDWARASVTLDVRVMMSERQDLGRLGRIVITGLLFCAIDPPEIDPARGYVPVAEAGLWIDAGPGSAAGASLPSIPEGCFLHWLFVRSWNRFIHICGRHAELIWLDDGPQPSRSAGRALFPGDHVPE